MRGDGTAAWRVTTGGHDGLPEHLAPLHDGTDVAGPGSAAVPALAVLGLAIDLDVHGVVATVAERGGDRGNVGLETIGSVIGVFGFFR